MAEEKTISIEELSAQVADLTDRLAQAEKARDEYKATADTSKTELEEARKLNQNLLNRIVSGVDVSAQKDFAQPQKSLDEVALEWFKRG